VDEPDYFGTMIMAEEERLKLYKDLEKEKA